MMDRRDFLHTGLVLGCTGLGCLALSGCSVQSSAVGATSAGKNGGTAGGRWGLVIDVEKYGRDANFKAIASACHKAHNIPDVPDDKQEIRWIREGHIIR